MSVVRQLVLALSSPGKLARLSGPGWVCLLAYLLAAAAALGSTAFLLLAHEGELRQLVLGYFFPPSWHQTIDFLVDRYLLEQQQDILINAIVGASLMVVTLLLFPLKEVCSARFEKDNQLTGRSFDEFSLWFQAWEEVKLFLLFVAVQVTIFWLGYHPWVLRRSVAVVLSYLFLFFSFAVDFLSPVLQRHQGRFSRIVKTLLQRPVAALTFGALFASPPLIAGFLWRAHPDWPLSTVIVVLFSANVVGISWAVVAGTWLGAQLLPLYEQTPRSPFFVRAAAWTVLLAVLGWNTYALAAVGASVHHKSQLLKCRYQVDWRSVSLSGPSWLGLMNKAVDVGIEFDVTIENPTAFDVSVEENRLELRHDGRLVTTSRLSPFAVLARETVTQRVGLRLALDGEVVKQGTALLDPNRWQIVLYVKVAPHLEFPVYLFPTA